MSVTALSDSDNNKLHKKPFHRRNDSSELDVFEAARYFSGANNEVSGYNNNNNNNNNNGMQKLMMIREDHKQQQQQGWRSGRVSLDFPAAMRSSSSSVIPASLNHHQAMEKQVMMKEKKYKQPSSPGGRLASFLNSLFNQTSSKKKKSKSTTQSMKDEDESPGGRRKRRSSISHFRSSSTGDHSAKSSLYSSSSSGFRTPPPYTPTKSCYNNKQVTTVLSNKPTTTNTNGHMNHVTKSLAEVCDTIRSSNTDYAWLNDDDGDDKFKSSNEKIMSKNTRQQYRVQSETRDFRKFDEIDEGRDSDSSSDLFELQNYDLGYYSSGLPVYETTHMDSIKRGAPISNGPV